MPDERQDLSDGEIALMDAIKTLSEVLIAKDIIKPTVLANMFAAQRDGYIMKRTPKAAAVMEMLRMFAADPERAAQREQIRKLMSEQSHGSA